MKTLTEEKFKKLSKAFHHLSESYLHREVSNNNKRKFGYELKNLFIEFNLEKIEFEIKQNGPADLKIEGLDDYSELALTAISMYSQLLKANLINEDLI